MRHEHVRMALLAMVNRLLSVADGLRQMILSQSESRRKQRCDSKPQRKRENSATSLISFLLRECSQDYKRRIAGVDCGN
jgi:hypothetical protein